MKKVLLLIFVCLTLLLSGCKRYYPQLNYYQSEFNFDDMNQKVIVPEGYSLIHNHPYDIVYMKNKCDIVFHLEKTGD